MRSRYSAFALRLSDYLLTSWHAATRPSELRLDPAHRWLSLEILATEAGGPDDTTGTVTFRARARSGDGRESTLTEHSRFERVAGAWVYVDGEVTD